MPVSDRNGVGQSVHLRIGSPSNGGWRMSKRISSLLASRGLYSNFWSVDPIVDNLSRPVAASGVVDITAEWYDEQEDWAELWFINDSA